MKIFLADFQPIKCTGLPEGIVIAALWLVNDGSAYVTGHPLIVDVGLIGWRM